MPQKKCGFEQYLDLRKERDETMMRVVLLTLLFLLLCGRAIGQSAQPTKIRVRGVELHYIEQGQGEPLILLHGGQGDYRSWEPQMKVLSPQFRVISYSRRYNYPTASTNAVNAPMDVPTRCTRPSLSLRINAARSSASVYAE